MTQKPPNYRRFRGHGREEIDPDDALDAIRALRDAEVDRSRAEAKTRPRATTPRTERPQRPQRPQPGGSPRWWSLRGRTRGQIAARVAAIIGLVVVAWGVSGFIALNRAASKANSNISNTARRALSDPGGGLLGTPTNTLVIGIDSRKGGTGGRADTVMIMRTDPDDGDIKYLSLPRDLRVAWGPDHIKLGETYSHRGITGLVGTIRRELGVPIHHVMLVDFGSVSRMVDAVGGVTISNPFDLKDCTYPGGITVSFPEGELDLDGQRALQYSRVRSCDGDLQRAERQQLVVSALQKKVLSFGSLPMAPFRGAKVIRTISTDMGTIDLAKFGWLQARLGTGSREVLATTGTMISGISYQILEPNAAGPQVREFSGG